MHQRLNFATKKRLKVQSGAGVLGRVRTVVGFFYRSTTAGSPLNQTLEQLEISRLKTLIDRAYNMLDRYLHIRPGICAAVNHFDLRNSV